MSRTTTTPSAASRVIKKLAPSQPGALRWAGKYGANLICVRYRLDATGERRYTTMELLVDEAPTLASRRQEAPVAVRGSRAVERCFHEWTWLSMGRHSG